MERGENSRTFFEKFKRKTFLKELDDMRRIREQVSEIVIGTNGMVLEGKNTVKRRCSECFGRFLNNDNERKAVFCFLGWEN